MPSVLRLCLSAALIVGAASPALAQRFEFARTFEVSGDIRLDVETERGRIDVVVGQPGRVVLEGVATVRVGWNVPANAVDLARGLAAAPPVEQAGDTVALRLPADRSARRAATLSYRIEVPADAVVKARSSSGATSVRGVAGAVEIRTQSATVTIADLAGPVRISTGSGDVTAHQIAGRLAVTTESSGFLGSRLQGALEVRTRSGAVHASFDGPAPVDVETGSSAIELRNVNGALLVKTQSGEVSIGGVPTSEWSVTTGSSRVSLTIAAGVGMGLDLASRSGALSVKAAVEGSVGQRAVSGIVAGGGPTVRVRTGSGAIGVSAR